MIYITIVFLMLILFVEIILTKRKLSPTIIITSIWLVNIVVCSFFESYLGDISDQTLFWIMIGCSLFFLGGMLGKILSNRSTRDINVNSIGIKKALPLYLLMFYAMFHMYSVGLSQSSNWYIGIRAIINYGSPDFIFRIFGYLYYIIYPIVFISAIAYYLNPSKESKKRFATHFALAVMYSIFTTAKIKILLVVLPVLFIRTYYKPTSVKLVIIVFTTFMIAMFASLFALDKLSESNTFTNSITAAIGNYTFANIFSFDSLQFKSYDNYWCSTDQSLCSPLPFYVKYIFKTNVYTIMYHFIDYGIIAYAVFNFFIGLIHNAVHQLARNSLNKMCIIISSVLYFPLIFQIMDDQYASSKYILWIVFFSYLLYKLNGYKLKFRVA
ncbi:hypothetical protein CHU32_09860 [Superficieibacter electus]|uniref:Oligosaccharide repeat unit polymerase n=1 Tax=Superficieibacter electus TaxID=2022662 RepID=A0A2P5GQN4_9ENTR|nr:hypothetical protein CHU33_15975 [Superficieibacter electus]POP48891.1 hypothetical protein CHU32_09860 [Superficieibacter electus]